MAHNRPPRTRLRALPAALALLALTSLPGAGAAVAATPPGATVVVAKNFMFAPVSLTIEAGATVTWTNRDDEPHTVVSDTGLFRSGALDTGESFSFRFDEAGTYHYACSIHPRMVGTVVVLPPPLHPLGPR
jgi:plastocyanin